MKKFLIASTMALAFAINVPLASANNNLKKREYPHKVYLSYSWLNHSNKISKLDVGVNKSDIRMGMFNIVSFDKNEKIEQQKKIREAEREINRRAAYGELTFKINDALEIEADYPHSYKGTKKLQIAETHAKVILDSLRSELGIGSKHETPDGTYYYINYELLAKNSVVLSKPVADAFQRNYGRIDQRRMLSEVLSFYQSIPYNPLRDKDYGFINTSEILYHNIGDCDSKALAFSGTVKNIYKNLDVILIRIEKHMFIGLNIPAEKTDLTLKHNNKTYVLADPTGPALRGIGSVGKKSITELRNNRYSVTET